MHLCTKLGGANYTLVNCGIDMKAVLGVQAKKATKKEN
jgi:hypothetical protein